MKRFYLLLLPCLLFAQSTIVFSPHNYGGNWQERDAKMKEHILAWLEQDIVATADIWFWDTYEYTVTDSAIQVYDMTQQNTLIVFRFLEPMTFNEASISSNWTNYTKASPVQVKGYKYGNFGPKAQIKAIRKMDKDWAKQLYNTYKIEVGKKENDGKNWYKDNKKMTKKEKRSFAWRIVTGKSSESEIEKK